MELQALQQECLACRRCGLCETRHSVVFGQGAAHAEVMLVGEGPGANEDEQGLPFVGKSGQLLDHYLEAVDLSRDKNVYIANIVKCRRRRTAIRCRKNPRVHALLRQQFQLIRPKIVVCLGRVAAQRMLDPGFSISRDHGKFFDKQGTLFMATTTPQRCCATQTTSPLSLVTLWPCGRKSQRSANIPIKKIPPDARREAAWSLKRWH